LTGSRLVTAEAVSVTVDADFPAEPSFGSSPTLRSPLLGLVVLPFSRSTPLFFLLLKKAIIQAQNTANAPHNHSDQTASFQFSILPSEYFST